MTRMASRGELEQRVMELLWAADGPLAVADVHALMAKERELAYTTVMTVLDRLAKKHMVERELVNRAWQYVAADPQHVVVAREMAQLLQPLGDDVRAATLGEFAKSLAPAERHHLEVS